MCIIKKVAAACLCNVTFVNVKFIVINVIVKFKQFTFSPYFPGNIMNTDNYECPTKLTWIEKGQYWFEKKELGNNKKIQSKK